MPMYNLIARGEVIRTNSFTPPEISTFIFEFYEEPNYTDQLMCMQWRGYLFIDASIDRV